MVVSPFNGVVLSHIVVYTSSFTKKTSLIEVTIFGLASLLAWSIVYIARFLLSIVIASSIRQLSISLKQAYYWHEFINVGFKKDSAKVISALSNDWKLLETNYFQLIFSIISNTMLFLVSLIYMMYVNSFISIFFIAFSFLPMIIPKLMKGKLVKYAKDWSIANEQYTKQIQYLKKYTK